MKTGRLPTPPDLAAALLITPSVITFRRQLITLQVATVMWNKFRELVRRIPLLSGLADCDAGDHWEALGETCIVLIFSTTPIWLGAIIIYATGDDMSWTAYKAALYGPVAKGELFMYCTALLAPLFWVALTDPPGDREFPSKVSHMVLIGLINAVAAVCFALMAAGKHLNPIFTVRGSGYMFKASIVLLYLGTVYRVSLAADARAEFKRQEADFTTALREHRQ
jgi:hypothetical protein